MRVPCCFWEGEDFRCPRVYLKAQTRDDRRIHHRAPQFHEPLFPSAAFRRVRTFDAPVRISRRKLKMFRSPTAKVFSHEPQWLRPLYTSCHDLCTSDAMHVPCCLWEGEDF